MAVAWVLNVIEADGLITGISGLLSVVLSIFMISYTLSDDVRNKF